MVRLSDRLMRLADEVQPGDRVADIGTDHGLLPIFLYENHIASKVILCDINRGPLEKARQNIAEYGVPGITDLRRGNGLEPLETGEADVIIIAGMGGLLMTEIIGNALEKARSCRRLVLQPRNSPEKLRAWLMEKRFYIVKESLVAEGKYICEIMTAVSAVSDEMLQGRTERTGVSQLLELEVSPLLFETKDPLLVSFLQRKIRIEKKIVEKVAAGSGQEDHARVREAEERLLQLERLLQEARLQL